MRHRVTLFAVGFLITGFWISPSVAQCSIDVDVDPTTSYVGYVSVDEDKQLYPNASMTKDATLSSMSYALLAQEGADMKSVSKVSYSVQSLSDPKIQNVITVEDDPNAGLRLFVKQGDGPNVEVTETCTACTGKVPVEFYGKKVSALTAYRADGSTFETTKFGMVVQE